MKLILASASPRRSEILRNCGFEFEVRVSDCEEVIDETLTGSEISLSLAKLKASSTEILDGEVIVAADTLVCYDDKVLGKPKSKDEAFKMIKMLSGKIHSVFTGVYIRSKDKEISFCSKSEVEFYELSDIEINNYINTGEPMDKAGAYGIQGKAAIFVKEINGDYFNIMGLPIARLARELRKLGVETR